MEIIYHLSKMSFQVTIVPDKLRSELCPWGVKLLFTAFQFPFENPIKKKANHCWIQAGIVLFVWGKNAIIITPKIGSANT